MGREKCVEAKTEDRTGRDALPTALPMLYCMTKAGWEIEINK
jgi:hypothetical protein